MHQHPNDTHSVASWGLLCDSEIFANIRLKLNNSLVSVFCIMWDLQGEDVDEDCGLDVVEEEELGPPPDQEVVRHVRELVLAVQYITVQYSAVHSTVHYLAARVILLVTLCIDFLRGCAFENIKQNQWKNTNQELGTKWFEKKMLEITIASFQKQYILWLLQAKAGPPLSSKTPDGE